MEPDVPEPTCYSATVNDWLCAEYVSDRADVLWDATVEHLTITVLAVGLGLLLTVPLTILVRRVALLQTVVLGASTVLYTIPSLAMFSLLVAFTGLGRAPVVIGLALYSLSVLLRNTVAGLEAVPADVRDCALGLGYGPMRMFAQVEVPLALPVIMAGVRVATVSTVALTTIGTIVGSGGLGALLAQAVDTDFKAQILTVSLLCVVLALVLDLLLVLAQRLATPWTRGV